MEIYHFQIAFLSKFQLFYAVVVVLDRVKTRSDEKARD